ncbi:MAG: radical SAM protein, partial [Thermoplasmatota archaeon]
MSRTPRDTSVVAPIPPYPLRHTSDDLERYRIQKYRSKQIPYLTESVCPECLLTDGTISVVDATVSEKDGTILLYKTCPHHGAFQEVYWSDADMFHRSMNYWYHTVGLDNPRTEPTNGCPYDCGPCPDHLAHTALGIIDVTTKCDLHCPVCFADAAAPGTIYEPAPADVLNMLTTLRENRPVPCPAVQFAGGEPTLSKYLPTYVRWAKHLGFDHIMVATNGLRISQNGEYVRRLRQAGMNTLYLQFDGMSRQSNVATRGLDLRQVKDKVLEHCRAASLDGVILVPTIIKGVNDDQLGDMIRFAVLNRDIVRCINFQPVSITGRIDYARRQLMRITIPEVIQKIAEQTRGRITQHDWYPVASMMAVGRALGLMKGIPTVELHAHFACGMATFLVIDKDGSYVPITQ